MTTTPGAFLRRLGLVLFRPSLARSAIYSIGIHGIVFGGLAAWIANIEEPPSFGAGGGSGVSIRLGGEDGGGGLEGKLIAGTEGGAAGALEISPPEMLPWSVGIPISPIEVQVPLLPNTPLAIRSETRPAPAEPAPEEKVEKKVEDEVPVISTEAPTTIASERSLNAPEGEKTTQAAAHGQA